MVLFSKIAAFVGLFAVSVAAHSGHGRPSASAVAVAVASEHGQGTSHHNADSAHDTHPSHHTNTNTKRGDFGVYKCKGRNWQGPCTWTKADGGACHNWIYGSGGSMGPDRGLVCRIYKAANCNDNGFHLDNFQLPGFPNYATNSWLVPNGMANGPASYKCKRA